MGAHEAQFLVVDHVQIQGDGIAERGGKIEDLSLLGRHLERLFQHRGIEPRGADHHVGAKPSGEVLDLVDQFRIHLKGFVGQDDVVCPQVLGNLEPALLLSRWQ